MGSPSGPHCHPLSDTGQKWIRTNTKPDHIFHRCGVIAHESNCLFPGFVIRFPIKWNRLLKLSALDQLMCPWVGLSPKSPGTANMADQRVFTEISRGLMHFHLLPFRRYQTQNTLLLASRSSRLQRPPSDGNFDFLPPCSESLTLWNRTKEGWPTISFSRTLLIFDPKLKPIQRKRKRKYFFVFITS